MKTDLNKWLRETANGKILKYTDGTVYYQHIRPVFVCVDGTTLSIQASETHYCIPRCNQTDVGQYGYSNIEVWCVTSAVPESWHEYGGDDSPYAYIPIHMVEEFIDQHGGQMIVV